MFKSKNSYVLLHLIWKSDKYIPRQGTYPPPEKKDSILSLSLVINIGAEFLGMKHERMLKIFLKTFEGRVSEI